jgi:hypothetical protein
MITKPKTISKIVMVHISNIFEAFTCFINNIHAYIVTI